MSGCFRNSTYDRMLEQELDQYLKTLECEEDMIRISENNIQLLCDECQIILEENLNINDIERKDKYCLCNECRSKLNAGKES